MKAHGDALSSESLRLTKIVYRRSDVRRRGTHSSHYFTGRKVECIGDGSTPGQVRSFSAGAVSPKTSVTVLPSDLIGQKGQDYDKKERYCELQWRTAEG